MESWEGRFFVTFTTVLEEKSFSRAADKLRYAQSTVTAHIRHLETTSGKKLFHRLPRGVEPTENGLRLAPYAYEFIRLGQSLQDAFADTGAPSGIVRLAALESFTVSHMPPFLTAFLQQFTKVKLRFAPGLKNDIIANVVNHQADAGILPMDPGRDDLHFTPLLEEKLMLVCSPALRERIERQGWGSLSDTAFISFGEQCIYHAYGRDVMQAAKVVLGDQLSFSSVELIKQTVSCGIGIAFVPESNVRTEIADGTLLPLPYDRQLTMTHGVITRKGREPNSAAQAFLQQLTDYFKKQ